MPALNKATTRKSGRSRPTFEDAAHEIAGNDAPVWLPQLLEWMAQSAFYERRLASIQSHPTGMRARLASIRKAASTILQSLDGPIDRPILESATPGRISSDLVQNLRDFILRVEAADALLSNSTGKTSRGRRKTLGGPSTSAKTLFAGRFSELWKHFRGKEPGAQEVAATNAVDTYWVACGGERHAGVRSTTNWRKHFEYVKNNKANRSLIAVRARCRDDIDRAVKKGRAPWSVPN